MNQTSMSVPVSYEAGFDIYRRAGIKKATFDKLSSGPWCPQPDIYIGFQPGWKPCRATRWLKETGRIDVHGRPARADRAGRPRRDEEPPRWYRKRPVRYLTAAEAARLLGRERKIIGRMKTAGYGPQAAVLIGDLEGYDIGEVVRLGEQYGWVEPGGASVRQQWKELCRYRNRSLKGRTMATKARKRESVATVA
ncbi:hypothetical protein [Streptomyces violaceusniger]|uniref:Uncharacterized protein n=1 Tax=Streptomyces violaceusniger (strain Tu 4113) TaxID=653045 RepID=G2PHH3_STRV4|nr:hypothetical protein [Streptomyces violaceusniger]AEM88819.1 hypothetical protein Strvi_0042 [Streptomyces violaceusniger Tu 4113]